VGGGVPPKAGSPQRSSETSRAYQRRI
jgi:hypothetical protein